MSVDHRPRLRHGLRFTRHEKDGVTSWVVKDTVALRYFRFGAVEAWLMQRMNGSRSLSNLCDELHEEAGLRATPAALDVLVRRLRELGLVERTPEERSALLMERLRTERRIRAESRSTLLRMRFSFGDPDPMLGRMVAAMPFFWTRGFVIASAALFSVYLLILTLYWQPFVDTMLVMYTPSLLTPQVVALSWITFFVTAIIHEFGHGLTCKRFGGEVHELGGMLLYFTPAFYCNVSDAWTFERRDHRLWVTFAGGWIQLWCAALGAVVWIITEPGTFINTVALFTAALSGAFSVLLNYNPLIPLDGYYALIDWLELPNLRARSFAYVTALLRRHALGLDVAVPAVTERERRIFLWYGIAAGAYTTLVLLLVAVFVGRFLVPRFGGWGLALFILLLLTITRRLRLGARELIRVAIAEKLPPGRAPRVALAALLLVILTAAVAAVAPWTVRATAVALVEPEARYWLRAAEHARLAELRVAEGARVGAGDTVAVLREPVLELERVALTEQARQLEAAGRIALASGNAPAARAAAIERASIDERLRLIEQRRSALVLRAPAAGIFVTPRLHERLGDAFAAGDSVGEVWADGRLRARLLLPHRDGAGLPADASVRIRFPSAPGVTWLTRLQRVEAAASGEHLVATAALPPHGDYPLRPGMQGRARIDVARTSAAGALERALRRTLRLELIP